MESPPNRPLQRVSNRHLDALRQVSQSLGADLPEVVRRELIERKLAVERDGVLIVTPLGQFYLQRQTFLQDVDRFLLLPMDGPGVCAAYREWLNRPSFLKIVDDYLAQVQRGR
jgi:hypothetical protein